MGSLDTLRRQEGRKRISPVSGSAVEAVRCLDGDCKPFKKWMRQEFKPKGTMPGETNRGKLDAAK